MEEPIYTGDTGERITEDQILLVASELFAQMHPGIATSLIKAAQHVVKHSSLDQRSVRTLSRLTSYLPDAIGETHLKRVDCVYSQEEIKGETVLIMRIANKAQWTPTTYLQRYISAHENKDEWYIASKRLDEVAGFTEYTCKRRKKKTVGVKEASKPAEPKTPAEVIASLSPEQRITLAALLSN